MSSTTIWGRAAPGIGRSTIAATAPASAAAATKSWPSAWAPGMATKTYEPRTCRESKVMPRTRADARSGPCPPYARRRDGALGRPDARRPPPSLEPLDQLPERAGLRRARRARALRPRHRRAPAQLPRSRPAALGPLGRPIARHSPASAACAGRPRCPSLPCFHRPMRSCIDLGAVEGQRGPADREPGPRRRRSRSRDRRSRLLKCSIPSCERPHMS